MAHGWDPYFQNLPPVPSDPRTLRGPSELEGSLSQHVENFTGNQDLSNTAASQEAPVRTSNFNQNLQTKPTVGNSDCIYQRHYGEMPWQSTGEQLVKDCLPRCENSNISEFAMDGLSTSGPLHSSFAPDFQELRQDCGMLTPSFLEDSSDIRSCSDADVGETRPSCKFMSNSPDPKPETVFTAKPSSSEWSFTSIGNISLSNDILCPSTSECASVLPNPSNVEVGNMVECPQDKMESSEKTCTQNYQFCASSNMVTNTGSETFEDSNYHDGCREQQHQEDAEEERPPTQGKESDAPIGSHENVTSDRVKECPSGNKEDQNTEIVPKSMATFDSTVLDDFAALKREKTDTIKQENYDFDEKILNCELDQDKNMKNGDQDKEIQTPTFELGGSEEQQVTIISQSSKGTFDSSEHDGEILTDESKESNKQADGVFEEQEVPDPNSTDCQGIDMRCNEQDKEIPLPSSSVLQSVKVSDSKDATHKVKEHGHNLKSSGQEVESCSQLPDCQSIESKAVDNDWSHRAESSGSHSVDTSNKEQSVSDYVACLHPNDLSMDTKPYLENEWTTAAEKTTLSTSTDQQQSLQECPQAIETQSLCGDGAEHTRESFQDLDTTSKEEQPVLDVPYGEAISREDTSCKADETKCETSQSEEWSVAKHDGERTNHVEEQASHLKSSVQMRKRLQPVVILEALEPVNARDISYHCADCQHTTQSVDHQIEHYHCSHLRHKFNFCQTCDIYMLSSEQAEKHLCSVTNETSQFSFDSSKTRRGHYTCTKCRLEFSKVILYIKHMRIHTGKTPFRCNQCGVYFAQNCSLGKHKRTPGRCKGKTEKSPLINSDAIVTETKATKQNDLEAKTEINDLLKNRPVLSLPECFVKLVDIYKSHICHDCGKRFSTSKKLKKHRYSVHKGKSGAVGSSQYTRKVTPDKTVADKAVQNKANGKYKCPLCPHLFKYSYNRARHLRECVRDSVYGGKRKIGGRYQCPLCFAVFTQASNRYRHIKSICLQECLSRLAKQRARSKKPVQNNNSKDNEQQNQQQANDKQKKQSKEHSEQKKQATATSTAVQNVPRYKCSLCPAVFCYASGKYRHMKKHELFKTTGKLFRYRKSIFSPVSKPATLISTKTEECNETTDKLSFSCHFCGKCFSTTVSLKKHEYNHKGEKPYCCLECGKKFKKRAYLISHKIVHQRRIQCTVCKKIFPSIEALIQHRNSHLEKGMLQCPDCPMQFQFPVYLLRHLVTHEKQKEAMQPEENSSFKPQLSAKSLKEQNGPMQHQCPLCKQVFDESQALWKHCLAHVPRSSSGQCPFCKRDFSNRRSMRRHMVRHIGAKPFSCGTCGKRFYSSMYFNRHLEKCSASKPKHELINVVTIEPDNKAKKLFKCSYCPRMLNRKNRLLNHHKGHKSNSLLGCTNCGQYFGHTKLSQHQKRCLGTSELNINTSSKAVCKNKISQANHKVHCNEVLQSSATMSLKSNVTEKLQHKCPHCPQKFKYRSLLFKHLVSHTGVQPYACMHCGRRYASQSVCLQHEAFCDGVQIEGQSKVMSDVATHLSKKSSLRDSAQKPQAEGEAEYKCKFCTKTFMKSRNLRRHILTHNEVKPYRCKACDCCFSRYDYLKVHQAHCKGKRKRLEVCIPKISLDDVGKGWQNKFGYQTSEKQQAFECNVCSRRFSSQSELSRHVTMFHDTKSFMCTQCGTSYSHETSLKKHWKTKKCRRVLNNTKASPPLRINPPTENVTKQVHGVKNQVLQRIQPYYNKKYKHVCNHCPRAFRNSWQLRVHTRLHTGEKPYSCENCGERFIRNDYLQRHFAKCTKRGTQTTRELRDRCGGFFPKNKIKNHKKSCISAVFFSEPTASQSSQSTPQSPPKGYSCAYCTSRFLLFSQLQEHFLNAHKIDNSLNPPISAVPLQQHLSNMGSIKEESLEEGSEKQPSDGANVLCNLDSCLEAEICKPFACPECNLSFLNKAGLIGHLRVHAKGCPFTCKICKKGFWNKSRQRNHLKKCQRLGNHSENTLKQETLSLKTEMDLTVNESVLVFKKEPKTTGTGVLRTNFSCKDDFKDAPLQKSKGNQEENTSSREKKVVQYQCSECDKSFTDGLMLISHLEDHGRQEQEKRRNICSKCGRVCSNQANLERHLRMHGIKEKYSCPDCSKKFYSPADLEAHRTCHDPNRAYACRICNQKFWKKTELLSHYSEYHPNDLFTCRFCDKVYSCRKSLVRHCKIWHKNKHKDGNADGTAKEKKKTEQSSSQESESDENSDEHNGSEDSDSDSAPYFPCHVCGKTFTTSESLEDHQRCHLGEKPHECAECGRCFFQASQLQQHQRMHKSEFQCQLCGRGFVSLFALRKHKHNHGKARPYRCSKCHLCFTGPSQLAEHMSTHREENFPCDICNRIFFSKSSRAEHRKKRHAESGGHVQSVLPKKLKKSPLSECSSVLTELKYRCGVCSERFKDPEELSEHGCLAATERLFLCPNCDKHFLHESHLKKHQIARHQPHSGQYQCHQCSISFSSSRHFLSHLKNHHNADTAVEICHEYFPNATELISNFPVHSEGTFECKICKMTFTSGSELDEHEHCHLTAATQFECTECGQSFLGSDAFRQHHCTHKQHSIMETEYSDPPAKRSKFTYDPAAGEDEEIDVTGEDLHNCPVCSKRFSSQSGLLEHQNKYHPNEKPFKCDLCGKSFALRQYLKDHKRRHLQKLPTQTTVPFVENQFKCNQCCTMFNTAQDLSSHMRMHAEKEVGEYRCDMCYKSFSQWSLLKQHQESHMGQVVYECTECDKAFAFPHLLEEHQQTHAGSSL
ncbi:hypothetical protein LDENG_00064950 [Lucifuga dentata]|nr:hypothetical protein LDENG_00064950 [Lucifuga dentata]